MAAPAPAVAERVAASRARHEEITRRQGATEEDRQAALIDDYILFRSLGGADGPELKEQLGAFGIDVKPRAHPELPFVYLFTGLPTPKTVDRGQRGNIRSQATERAAFWGAIGHNFQGLEPPTRQQVLDWLRSRKAPWTAAAREHVKAVNAHEGARKQAQAAAEDETLEPSAADAAWENAPLLLEAEPSALALPAGELPPEFAIGVKRVGDKFQFRRLIKDYPDGLQALDQHLRPSQAGSADPVLGPLVGLFELANAFVPVGRSRVPRSPGEDPDAASTELLPASQVVRFTDRGATALVSRARSEPFPVLRSRLRRPVPIGHDGGFFVDNRARKAFDALIAGPALPRFVSAGQRTEADNDGAVQAVVLNFAERGREKPKPVGLWLKPLRRLGSSTEHQLWLFDPDPGHEPAEWGALDAAGIAKLHAGLVRKVKVGSKADGFLMGVDLSPSRVALRLGRANPLQLDLAAPAKGRRVGLHVVAGDLLAVLREAVMRKGVQELRWGATADGPLWLAFEDGLGVHEAVIPRVIGTGRPPTRSPNGLRRIVPREG